ncbi:hypothetical protein AB6849_03140 [Serratia proteamaculans]|uniref:hypothetical protein n=1 Tax=Serratia proteamaculans TaxID=28151 RepID=UPI001C559CBA|nr:hypothetical protein [Serratia proteamaculans]WEO89431.1 hypothetical protein JET59_025430 [Serratia proteamaculans]
MDFDFDEMAYPDVFLISGKEFKGSRKTGGNQVDIPFTDEPHIDLGDILVQKVGSRELNLKVIDLSISKNGTLNVGTDHPHILTLSVANLSADAQKPKNNMNTFNIGSVSGTQVQIGESNSQVTNISIQELVEKIASSNDKEAKSLLMKLLENSTVASIVGAGAATLFSLL